MSVVLVTGCGSGFGEAIAAILGKQDHQVVATLRRPEAAPASLTQLAAERPGDVVIAALDVNDAAARRRVIDDVQKRFGRLDVLINCAGVGATGPLEDMPEAVWRQIFETNFFGPLELMRLALPIMRQQRAGRIVNITSVASLFSTPFMSAYSASKQALDAASIALDIEARSFGVRVAAIVAGPFKTGLAAKGYNMPASEPYAVAHGHYKDVFKKLEAHAATDLSPVLNAIIAATTDTDPKLRYTAGVEPIPFLPNLLEALMPEQVFGLKLTGQG